MEKSTRDKPEVWAIAEVLDIDPDAVLGKLFRVWCWFDEQSRDGHAPSVTKKLLDRDVGVTGFCDAMCKVGWLIEKGGQIEVPNFGRHNGKSAKKRALANDRKKNQRSREERDKSVTREEKRRGSSVPNGTGADAPKDPKKHYWKRGRDVLVAQGVPYRDAGSLLGRLLKVHGEDPTVPLDVIDTIERDNIADPASWLGAMFKPENTLRLPRDDAQLPGWASKNGLPDPRPGEDYPTYRTRLTRLMEDKRRVA